MQLRPYQSDLVDRTRAALRSSRRVLVQLATGGGKTVIFSDIIRRATARGGRVLVLAHRREFIDQALNTLARNQIAAGVIMAQRPTDFSLPVQVASVQTLARRRIAWEPTIIIVDEAHHATATSYRGILGKWPSALVIGFTATPCRSDDSGLGDIFEQLICGPAAPDLIAGGYLKPVEMFSGSSVQGLRVRMGEFDTKQQADAEEKPKIIGDAVSEYAKICPGVPAIVFAVNVAEAERVAARFVASGWRARAVHGSSPDRAETLQMMADGELDVVTSCELIGEGTDIPRCGAVILLRATKSLGLYLQWCGRAMRPHKDYPTCYVLDHGGNARRFDIYPDDEIEWSLEKGLKHVKKKPRELMPGRCFTCLEMLPAPVAPICPLCEGPTRKPMAEQRYTAGELVRIEKRAAKAAAEAKRKAEREKNGRSLREWFAIAAKSGKPESWALQRHAAEQAELKARRIYEARMGI